MAYSQPYSPLDHNEGNAYTAPTRPIPLSNVSSYNSNHRRQPSPTSVDGLLSTPGSQFSIWSTPQATPVSNASPNFNNNNNATNPSYFQTSYDSHEALRQEKDNAPQLVHARGPKPRFQLIKLLGDGAISLSITLLFSGLYIFTLYHYGAKGAMNETEKRKFNTWTTAMSIALGLNIASGFKGMALNLRWWILSRSVHSLNDLDLILRCDSMRNLGWLISKFRGPFLVTFCIVWVLLNLLAQVGIATLSLTYGFENALNSVLLSSGNVSFPDLSAFYPRSNVNPSLTDQAFTAHSYGMQTFLWGVDTTGYLPTPGSTVQPANASVYMSTPKTWHFNFFESPPTGYSPATIFTNRSITSNYTCTASPITSNGNGRYTQFSVQNHGLVNVTLALPNATVFFTEDQYHDCASAPKNTRCARIQVFEASDSQPWYYNCDISLSTVSNLPATNIPRGMALNDTTAFIAASSIAMNGYTTTLKTPLTGLPQEANLYPADTFWGYPLHGDADAMGQLISLFAIGAIASASYNNPLNFYEGMSPASGQMLSFHGRNVIYFYVIIGLLNGCQLALVVLCAVLANRVEVRRDSDLAIAELLAPVVGRMRSVVGAYEEKRWRRAGRGVGLFYRFQPGNGGGQHGEGVGAWGLDVREGVGK